MTGRFRALTFDVGYTLFNDRKLVRSSLPQVHSWLCRNGLANGWEHFHERFFHFDRALDHPSYSHTFGEKEIWDAVLKDLGMEKVSSDEVLQVYREHLLQQLEHSGEEYAALQWAKSQGYQIGLITNERSIRINTFIDHAGFRPFLDSIMISEEKGVGKPAPEFFQMALEDLKVSPEETIHFGDNEITDGACKQLGMRFVLVTGYKDQEWTWGDGTVEEPDMTIDFVTQKNLERAIQALS